MSFIAKLDLTVSRIRPLWFLLCYLIAIPTFGLLYAFATPHGFYAPYARYEPGANSDTTNLQLMLERALRRSIDSWVGEDIIVGTQKLNRDSLRDSLRVDDVNSTDGTALSFRVRFNVNDIVDFAGERQLGWSFVTTIPEQPNSAILGPSSVIVYRFPVTDFSKYTSPFKEQNEKLFNFVFGQGNYGFGILAPALALSYQEDLQLRRYLQGVRAASFDNSGGFWRMVYVSALVITSLGLGDIVPTTSPARCLVASEAAAGIVLAGLFLNALAYRASRRGK